MPHTERNQQENEATRQFTIAYIKEKYPLLVLAVEGFLRIGGNVTIIESWRTEITKDENLRAGLIELIQQAEQSNDKDTLERAAACRYALLKPYFPTPQ